MNETAKKYVEKLQLIQHPEGGYFKEVYRSDENIPGNALPERFGGERSAATSIYFLLHDDNVSSFHRIKSDETWHFYDGTPLIIYMIDKNGVLEKIFLGEDAVFQFTVPGGCWFASEVHDKNSFSLVGCTVAPGFDFNDFELAKRDELIKLYPTHKELIFRLTKA